MEGLQTSSAFNPYYNNIHEEVLPSVHYEVLMFNPSGCLLYASCGLTSHPKAGGNIYPHAVRQMPSMFLYVLYGLCSGPKYLAVRGALNAVGPSYASPTGVVRPERGQALHVSVLKTWYVTLCVGVAWV